jgi:antitoxin MazE
MRVQFDRWGNSLAVRIPSAFAREIGAVKGKAAEITVENGSLVIRPVDDQPVYRLEDLVARITEENRYDEVDTGPAVGNEFG